MGDDTDRQPDGANRRGRRLVVVLAVVAAIALLAVAGLVGYIIADHRDSDGDHARDVGIAADLPADEVPDLRPVAEAALADGATAERADNTVAAFRAWVDRYAVPACGEMLIGIAEAFGDGENAEPEPELLGYPKVVSLDQDGSRGVVVTKSAPNADPETIHWIYNGSEWRFTCEGVFDGTDETQSAEPTRTTPRRTTSTPPAQASDPVLLGPCFAYEDGRQSGTLACSADSNGTFKWHVLSGDEDRDQSTPAESNPVVQGPCYEWEHGEIRGNLQCMNSPGTGYIWLPGAN